ncbi:phosphoglycerol transferase [Sporobacter termitidis DSM 10068]|uniref:Phosphoglycerol transferase n=1 Tax=Sporobacter termitidis DSM 10068 TaxID=1123282 RepID=A0A1M5Z570_9FIRM|nr:LTA synthase family protein [Sporobacter termitidis]SHI19350.1 phosphoglycerol transferase [Sporobacter termitidis DSM 10068]
MKRHSIKIILLSLLFFMSFLFYRLINWMRVTFAGVTLEKIVFELRVPLEGTSKSTIWSAISYCVCPALGLTLLLAVLLLLCDRARKKRFLNVRFGSGFSKAVKVWPLPYTKAASLLLSLTFLSVGILQANRNFELFGYIDAQVIMSPFIEDNYIGPEKANLTFPDKKRNLIYIYLESMESTYADTASGGAFPENYIPELTDLASQYINFSNTDRLGGALPVSGTQWTMGAMFATSTGLPINLPLVGGSIAQQFFPGATGIGTILENNGYHNVLFIGSDATFGGRRLFFTQHGNYEICDYDDAKAKGLIPEDYYVWWGYEDEKLFSFAKDKLTELGKSSQPFNFTMLTADTHEFAGYVCRLCGDRFGTQYANVIACSSKQVFDFVRWIQRQNFYKNTTIVITGDHLTMDSTLTAGVPPEKRSVYNCFINAAPAISREKTKNRQFSALDLFPTVLAGLGVRIEGDQLGLGVNLFSGKQTLYEKYGPDLSRELSLKSAFYNRTFIHAK